MKWQKNPRENIDKYWESGLIIFPYPTHQFFFFYFFSQSITELGPTLKILSNGPSPTLVAHDILARA